MGVQTDVGTAERLAAVKVLDNGLHSVKCNLPSICLFLLSGTSMVFNYFTETNPPLASKLNNFPLLHSCIMRHPVSMNRVVLS